MSFTGTWALPMPVFAGTFDDGGDHGYVGDNALPLPTLTGTFGVAFNAFTGDKTLPLPSLSGSFIGSGSFVGNFTLPKPILSGVFKNGNVYVGDFELPMPVLTGAFGSYAFSGAWALPMPLFDGRFEAAITAAFRGWPVNLKNFALTEYGSVPFNSFCRLNGEYLAAGDGGIFALSGASDNGVNIDATIRFASSDLLIQQLKRPEDVYINYRSDGTLLLRVVIEGGETYEYPLEPTGKTGMYQVRVKPGKGISVNYLCLEIANVDGCDFDLDSIRVRPAILSRSIGGN